MLKRIVYLGYYFKGLDKPKLNKFMHFVTHKNHISKASLWMDVLKSSITYNISILDYFYFRFYDLNAKKRATYAGTGYMFEYQLQMNPRSTREILENKILFLKGYSKFINHNFYEKKQLLKNDEILQEILKNKSSKIVLKSSDGQCGEGVEVYETNKLTLKGVKTIIANSENDLVEDFIVQHDDLMRLSPSGLNTLRIFSQLNTKGEVEWLGARLRITINSNVDNLAAGNIAAEVNLKTGIVEGPGVYSDITKEEELKHPITGVQIVGFQVPFWKESLQLVKDAALIHPENRSIGWDVAITNDGPELLEANHNWCKLLWQLPVKKGLKQNLEKYIK